MISLNEYLDPDTKFAEMKPSDFIYTLVFAEYRCYPISERWLICRGRDKRRLQDVIYDMPDYYNEYYSALSNDHTGNLWEAVYSVSCKPNEYFGIARVIEESGETWRLGDFYSDSIEDVLKSLIKQKYDIESFYTNILDWEAYRQFIEETNVKNIKKYVRM